MIAITDHINLDPGELEFSFVRASGPGGQNVNKVSSAVQLRFNAAASPSLPPHVRSRVVTLAGRRANRHGIIVIEAKRFRHQTRNREDALDRLVALIVDASKITRPRRASKPSKTSKKKRLNEKKRRGTVKQLRRGPGDMD
ncbi:MAG: aminoacyl-tRNA hydrolase [Rhodospirillaceae bacterium]|jgi:ribosome-associated protein|nr:aminoacyl-tRNA hydrolase [Rhodospirillaceae bacterium]MBT5240179.1 aminoacyl-tRNA hydrolase [Rhodospirillaceae bacterium]MBT5566958.1 aminoacyl-tRNA hydrolase [Rhodospirillaceae bacterium]MBT6090355.1 aminoacyl-tRNA hydrolase [Rhodospirillaceae bacterium]MBT6959737.1 aminoacyl-tRNA hydrolase [Rhodospirillaceae bacterium]